MNFRRLAALALLAQARCLAAENPVYVLDFTTQPDGPAIPWLKKQGFEFKLDFDELNPRFKGGALWLSTDTPKAGICGLTFAKGKDVVGANRLRLTWGVGTFPAGADFEHGKNRLSLGVAVSFGRERLSSGLPFGAGATPYFICPFLGACEPAGKVYTGQYWKAGGRYVCARCDTPGAVQVNEFDLTRLFGSLFGKRTIPAISAIAIQMNTKDTEGHASAFLKKIELLP